MSATLEQFQARVAELVANKDFSNLVLYLDEQHGRGWKLPSSVPHQTYVEVNLFEVAIIYDQQRLMKAVRRWTSEFKASNHEGFSLEYLAVLHNYSGPYTVAEWERTKPQHYHYTGMRSDNELCLASGAGHLKVIEHFAKTKGKDLSTPFTPGQRLPIETAALFNRFEACKLLLSYDYPTDTLQHQCDMGNALHIGGRFGFDRVVHALLQNKPPAASYLPLIEECDAGGFTALGLAVVHLHPAAVQVLLEAGANLNTEQGIRHLTPLQLVLSLDCQLREEYISLDKFARDKIVSLLLQYGASTASLTKEQLAYIEDLNEREKTRALNTQPHASLTGDESEDLPLIDYGTSEDSADTSPSKNKPKKTTFECKLCDKKFTSDVSLQAHNKSKGHLKQLRKQEVESKVKETAPELLVKKQIEVIGLIERLPLFSELLYLVFAKLDVFNLRRFAATCKGIRMLIEKRNLIWRDVQLLPSTTKKSERLTVKKHPTVFEDILAQMPNIQKFTYLERSYADDEMFHSMFVIPRLCSNLEELNIKQVSKEFPISFLNNLFGTCTRLRRLKMRGVSAFKPSKIAAVNDGKLNEAEPEAQPPNPKKPWKVKKVKKSKTPKAADWLADLDKSLPNVAHCLEYLNFEMDFKEEKVTPDQYVQFYTGIFKRCPNLKTLVICSYQTQADTLSSIPLKNVLMGAFDACPKLSALRLYGTWLFGRLSNAEYDALFRKIGQLEEFKVSAEEITNFDRDIAEYLADYCTKMTTLKLDYGDDVPLTNGRHYPISRLTQLRRFLYGNDMAIEDENQVFLRDVLSSCTNLQQLKLRFDPPRPLMVQSIAQYGAKLESLIFLKHSDQLDYSPLSKCTNLTRLHINGLSLRMFYTIIGTCHKLRDLDLDFYETPEEENNNNAALVNNAAPANNAPDNNNAAPVNNAAPGNNNAGEQQPENNGQAQNNANDNNAQANQNQPIANNDVPVPAAVVNEFSSKYLNLGRLFEKCTNLTRLATQAPLGVESFRYQLRRRSADIALVTNHTTSSPFVSTSIQRLSRLCALNNLESDLPVFFIGECCPNLVGLDLDYSFSVSHAIEYTLTHRLPELEMLSFRNMYRYKDCLDRANQNRIQKFNSDSY